MGDTDVISEGGTGQPTTGAGGLAVPLGVHIAELSVERTRRLEAAIDHVREVAGYACAVIVEHEFTADPEGSVLRPLKAVI